MSFSDFHCMDDISLVAANDDSDSDAEESTSKSNTGFNFNDNVSSKNETEETFSSFANDSYAKMSSSSWNFFGRVTGILSACSTSSIATPSTSTQQQAVDNENNHSSSTNNNNNSWPTAEKDTDTVSSTFTPSTTQEKPLSTPVIDCRKCSKLELSNEETRDSENQFNWKNSKSSHIFIANDNEDKNSSSFSPYTPSRRSSSGIFKKLGALIGFNKLDTSHTFEPIEDEQIRHHRDIMNPTLLIGADGYMLPLAHLATANCKKSSPENDTEPDISYCKDVNDDDDPAADADTDNKTKTKNEDDENCDYCIKIDDDEKENTDEKEKEDKDEKSAKKGDDDDEDEEEEEEVEQVKMVCPSRFEIRNCPIMRGFCPTPFEDPAEPFKDFQCCPEWNRTIGQTMEDCCCHCCEGGGEDGAAASKASQEECKEQEQEEANAFLPSPSKTYPPMPKMPCVPLPTKSESESESGSGAECKEEEKKEEEVEDECSNWARRCAKKIFSPTPFDNPQSTFNDFQCDECAKLNRTCEETTRCEGTDPSVCQGTQELPFCEDDLPICPEGQDPYGNQIGLEDELVYVDDDLPYCEDAPYYDEDLPYCDAEEIDDGMADLPYCDEEVEVPPEPSCDDKLKSYQQRIDELNQTLQCCEQKRNPVPSSTKPVDTSCEEKSMPKPMSKDPCVDENQNESELAKSARTMGSGCDSCLCKLFGICSTCNSEAAAAAAAAKAKAAEEAAKAKDCAPSSAISSSACDDSKTSLDVNCNSNSNSTSNAALTLPSSSPPPSAPVSNDCCATIPLRMDDTSAGIKASDCPPPATVQVPPTLNKTCSDSDQKLRIYRQKIAEMQKKLRCCHKKEQEKRQKNCEQQLQCYKQKLVEIQKVLRTIQENQRKAVEQLNNNNNNIRANQMQDCRPIQVIIPPPRISAPRGGGPGPHFPPCPPYGQIPGQPWGNYPAYPPPQYRQPPPPPGNFGYNPNDFNNNPCGPSRIPVPVPPPAPPSIPVPAAAAITPLVIPFSDCGSCSDSKLENTATGTGTGTATDPCQTSESESGSKVEAEDPEKIAAEDLRKCRARLTELKRKVFACHGIDPNTVLDENRVERLPNESCTDSLQCCKAMVQIQEHKLRSCKHDNDNNDNSGKDEEDENAKLAKEKAAEYGKKRGEEDKATREKLSKYFRTSCKGYDSNGSGSDKNSSSNSNPNSNGASPRPSRIPIPISLSTFSSSCSPLPPPENPPNYNSNNNNNNYNNNDSSRNNANTNDGYGYSSSCGGSGGFSDPSSAYTFPDSYNYYGGHASNPQGYNDSNYYDFCGQNYGNDYANYPGSGSGPQSGSGFNSDCGSGSGSTASSGRSRTPTSCDEFKEELVKLEREFEQLLEQERMKSGSGCGSGSESDEKSIKDPCQNSDSSPKPQPPAQSQPCSPPPPTKKDDDRCKSINVGIKNKAVNSAYDPPPSRCEIVSEKLTEKWEKFDQVPLTKVRMSCEGSAEEISKAFNSTSEYFVKEDFETAAKKQCPEKFRKIPVETKKKVITTGKSQCDLSCFASPTRMDIHKMDQQLIQSMCKCPTCINKRYEMDDANQADEEDQEPEDPCKCPECGACLDENGCPVEDDDEDDENDGGDGKDSCGRVKDKCKSDKFDLDNNGKPIYEGGMCLSRAQHYMWKSCGNECDCPVRALGLENEWSGFDKEENDDGGCKQYKGGQTMQEAQDFMWNKCGDDDVPKKSE